MNDLPQIPWWYHALAATGAAFYAGLICYGLVLWLWEAWLARNE